VYFDEAAIGIFKDMLFRRCVEDDLGLSYASSECAKNIQPGEPTSD